MAELRKLEVELPKEAAEVLDPVVDLVRGIKEKKPLSEIVSSLLPKVISAVEGADMIDDEAAMYRKEMMQLAALRVADLVDILLPKKVE